MIPQGKIQRNGGQTGCQITSQASAEPFPWYVGVADRRSPCSCPVVSLHHNFPSAACISGPFSDSARSSPGQMDKASSCRTQACPCQSPSLLHWQELHLFLKLQQMDTSMNPSITRKAKEIDQTVPGWEPFTIPEVRRLDSCTNQ